MASVKIVYLLEYFWYFSKIWELLFGLSYMGLNLLIRTEGFEMPFMGLCFLMWKILFSKLFFD